MTFDPNGLSGGPTILRFLDTISDKPNCVQPLAKPIVDFASKTP